MCGICGIAGQGADAALVRKMCASMAHRGPDAGGLHEAEGVVLGHRRLSIIDLVTGDQPMCNEDGSVCVVLNGEIYNFRELRGELKKCGHRFFSTSDTEVLLHGYEEYGLKLLPRLDGIFAFAIWDNRTRRLLLVRDYFGVKPLHIHFDGRTLRFASEIKAILQDPAVPRLPDLQSMHYFLNLRYIPGDGTLFKDIRRLPAGHYLIHDRSGMKIRRYFELHPEGSGRMGEDYYAEGVRHYLRRAVEKQMVSDVPLGVYLSGGLDSSAIVAFMSEFADEPVRTFSVGFNEPTDELEDARVIADHFSTEHYEIALEADPLTHYPEVIWHAEEPKENILQGYLLARFARSHVKVVQGGLGGDELIGGYDAYRYVAGGRPLHALVPEVISTRLLKPLSGLAYSLQGSSGLLKLDEYRRALQLLLSAGDPQRFYLILRNTWDHDRDMFKKVYGEAMLGSGLHLTHSCFDRYFINREQDPLEQVLRAEFNTKMVDDFLMNEDRTSMAHGLEVRVPFLDRDLVQFAMGMPLELKIKRGQTKYIFRKAMKGILPARAISKRKWGFTFDPYHQFRKDLKGVAEKVLTRRVVEDRGWFNYRYLRSIIDHPPHPRLHWHYFFLWLAVGLEIWARMFLDSNSVDEARALEAYFGD